MTIPSGEDGVAVDDDLAVSFLDRQKLIPGAIAERLRRLVGFVLVFRFGRKRNRGDDGDASLDARLTQRRKQPHFVDGMETDPIGDVAQESLGRFDHARTFEGWAADFPAFLSINSRST